MQVGSKTKTGPWGLLTLSGEEKIKSVKKSGKKRREERQENGVFWKPSIEYV